MGRRAADKTSSAIGCRGQECRAFNGYRRCTGLEVLPPVTTQEDLPFGSEDDIAYEEIPMEVIKRPAIIQLPRRHQWLPRR